SAKSFLELNYSFNNNSSDQKKLTHDDDGGGHYGKFVDSLSSDYHYIYNTHSVGMNYRLNEKKYNLSVGGNISNTTFNQRDHFLNKGRRDHYYNFFPRGNINYKFNSYTNLRLSYNGSTRQPTIEQLQPLVNNEDPLNIVIGNPDLK